MRQSFSNEPRHLFEVFSSRYFTSISWYNRSIRICSLLKPFRQIFHVSPYISLSAIYVLASAVSNRTDHWWNVPSASQSINPGTYLYRSSALGYFNNSIHIIFRYREHWYFRLHLRVGCANTVGLSWIETALFLLYFYFSNRKNVTHYQQNELVTKRNQTYL